MATHFVPTEEIQKLTLDSYECLASKIDEAISKDAAKVFGESVPNKVERIGTFSDHVLLAADDGRFVKVKYERSNTGAIRVLTAESVAVPLYTESNISTYLMQEARTIVDSILAHDTTQAEIKLRALAPFVDGKSVRTEEQRIESVISTIRSSRPWKSVYEARKDQVVGFLGESLKEIESRKLTAKYDKLFSNVSEEQSLSHKELVQSDLNYMAEFVGKLLQSMESIRDLKEIQTRVAGKDRDAVTTFGSFVEDLKRDLQDVREAVLESVKSIHSAVCLGKLYDALAEESFHYEVAEKFASMMSAELGDSK